MSTLTVKELSHPAGEVIKIAAGKTLDLNSQGNVTMPTGSVLQVVSVKYGTSVTVTSGTYQDSGLTLSITPTSTNSKIMVLANVDVRTYDSAFNARADVNLVRGSTTLNNTFLGLYVNAGTDNNFYAKQDFMHLDSPATTSSTTYKVQGKVSGADTIRFNDDASTFSTITLMEIQG